MWIGGKKSEPNQNYRDSKRLFATIHQKAASFGSLREQSSSNLCNACDTRNGRRDNNYGQPGCPREISAQNRVCFADVPRPETRLVKKTNFQFKCPEPVSETEEVSAYQSPEDSFVSSEQRLFDQNRYFPSLLPHSDQGKVPAVSFNGLQGKPLSCR